MDSEVKVRIGYDWNAPIMSGTIVCSKFNTFSGEERTGLFCILYDEQIDGNVLNKKNVLAIKLTTQDTTIGDYTVAVNGLKNPFLDQRCTACCSKRVTIYSLDVLLFLFGTSLVFHVQF